MDAALPPPQRPIPVAFDALHPPDPALLEVCVHCGFCLPTCPTYVLWGQEMDSPRGRITLMEQGWEPGADLAEMAVHFDRCLGCMACVTACPSGVRYDRLIEAVRPQVERHVPRSRSDRAFRRALFATFTHPARLRALLPLLAAYRRVGGQRLARGAGLLRRFPRLQALDRLAPPSIGRKRARMPALVPARGALRGRVGLLQGCVQRVFFGGVNAATARVLAAEGFELVVVNAAGCGSAMKGYGHLLADDPVWSDRAARFSSVVRDVHEVLAAEEPRATRHPVHMSLAYHDACHLAHAQRIRTEPRRLLEAIPGVRLVEPAGWEVCCGSAGLYNVLEPKAGADLGRLKAERLLATGAQAIASANPGCSLQIATHLQAVGRPLPVYHPVEVLDASIRNAPLAAR